MQRREAQPHPLPANLRTTPGQPITNWVTKWVTNPLTNIRRKAWKDKVRKEKDMNEKGLERASSSLRREEVLSGASTPDRARRKPTRKSQGLLASHRSPVPALCGQEHT